MVNSPPHQAPEPIEVEPTVDELSSSTTPVLATTRDKVEHYLDLACRELEMNAAVVVDFSGPEPRLVACLAIAGASCAGAIKIAARIVDEGLRQPDGFFVDLDAKTGRWPELCQFHGVAAFVACRTSPDRSAILCLTSSGKPDFTFDRGRLEILREACVRLDYELRIAEKEDELSLSRSLFEAFMNNSPVAAFLKTSDGTHLYANRPKEAGLRLWAEGFLGRNDFEKLPRQVAENIRVADQRVIDERETVLLTEKLWIPELGHRHLQLLKFPVTTPDGQTLIGSVAIDVTERVMAQEALRTQVQSLVALNAIKKILVAGGKLQVSLGRVLEEASRVVPCSGAAIYTVSPSTFEYSCVASRGELDRRTGSRFDPKTYAKPDFAFHTHQSASDGPGTISIRLRAKGQEVGLLRYQCELGHTPSSQDLDFLHSIATAVAMAVDSDRLLVRLEKANEELNAAYHATLNGWSRSLDARDRETEGHSQRVATMALALAKRLGFPEDGLLDFQRGALLHDIGKIGIPDSVLHKPGPLDEEEWAVMRRHPEIAKDMLSEIGFLARALDIPYCHHEKWDGTGYPQGLRAREIPWSARIFSVVDVFDALTSDRPYRKAWTRGAAIKYIEEQSGRHFDPIVAGEFVRMICEQTGEEACREAE